MLNYAAAAPQPGITMPSGIPGAGGAFDPTMPSGMAGLGGGGAPMSFGGGMPMAGMMPPGAPEAPDKFLAETQEDGSILLRWKGPGGRPGPVAKIVPPIKPFNSGK